MTSIVNCHSFYCGPGSNSKVLCESKTLRRFWLRNRTKSWEIIALNWWHSCLDLISGNYYWTNRIEGVLHRPPEPTRVFLIF